MRRLSIRVGPWSTLPTAGDAGADIYTRTTVAVLGLFALRRNEATYFTASTDDDGNELRADEEYIVSMGHEAPGFVGADGDSSTRAGGGAEGGGGYSNTGRNPISAVNAAGGGEEREERGDRHQHQQKHQQRQRDREACDLPARFVSPPSLFLFVPLLFRASFDLPPSTH